MHLLVRRRTEANPARHSQRFEPRCVFRGKSATDSGIKSATYSDLISAIPI